MEKFVPRKDEKEIISLRISLRLLEEVDTQAAFFEMSRNAFINQCIQYALANMEDEQPGT